MILDTVLLNYFLKSLVDPDDSAFLIKKCVRQLQFLKEPLLYLAIFRGKADQFIY